MTLVVKRVLSEDEKLAALLLLDGLLFVKFFWQSDLTVPQDRYDLWDYRGRCIVSREQRIMFLAGSDYALLRNVMPDVTHWSPARIAIRTARKVGKTINTEARWIQIALCYKHDPEGTLEGLIHTPADDHIAPILERVMAKIKSTPFFNLMHDSFDARTNIQTWRNGWHWHITVEGMIRKPELAGRSQVGARAHAMIGDEADFSLEPMWEQREQSALPTAFIMEAGVPRGFRSKFWKICSERSTKAPWMVVRTSMRANPIYHSESAWKSQISGGYRTQRVQTQVLGLDGQESVVSFPVIPVDHTQPYVYKTITIDDFERARNTDELYGLLALPFDDEYQAYVMALDYGYSPSPSELFVLGLRDEHWRTLARFEFLRCDTHPMAEIINFLDVNILPKMADFIALDAHGAGSGVLSSLQRNREWENLDYKNRVFNVNFAGQIKDPNQLLHTACRMPVENVADGGWYCRQCKVRIYARTALTERNIPVKTHLLTNLKEALAYGQRVLRNVPHPWNVPALVLGWDEPLINQLSNATEVQLTNGVRIISPDGQDHIIDATLAAIAGILQWIARREKLADQSQTNITEFGWLELPEGEDSRWEWRPPWQIEAATPA